MKLSTFFAASLVLGTAHALSVPVLREREQLNTYNFEAEDALQTCAQMAESPSLVNAGDLLFADGTGSGDFDIIDVGYNSGDEKTIGKVGFIVVQSSNAEVATDATASDCPADWSVSLITAPAVGDAVVTLGPSSPSIKSDTASDNSGLSYSCKFTEVPVTVPSINTANQSVRLSITNSANAGANGCKYRAQIVYVLRKPYTEAPLTQLAFTEGLYTGNLIDQSENSNFQLSNYVGKPWSFVDGEPVAASADAIELVKIVYTDPNIPRIKELQYKVAGACPAESNSTFTVEVYQNDTRIDEWSILTAQDTETDLTMSNNGFAKPLTEGGYIDTSNTNFTIKVVPTAAHQCHIFAAFDPRFEGQYGTEAITQVVYKEEDAYNCNTIGSGLSVWNERQPNFIKINGGGADVNTTLINIPQQSADDSVTILGFSYTIKAFDGEGASCGNTFDVITIWGNQTVSQLSFDSENNLNSCWSNQVFIPPPPFALKKRSAEGSFVELDTPIDTALGGFKVEVGPGSEDDSSCHYVAQFRYDLKPPYNETTITELTGSDPYDAQATCENIDAIAADYTAKVHNLVSLRMNEEVQTNITVVDIPQATNETLGVDIYRIGYTVKVSGLGCSNFNITAFMNETEMDVLHTTNDTEVQDCIAYSLTQDFEQPISTSAGNLKVYIVPEVPSACQYLAHIVYNDFETVEPTPTPEPTLDGDGPSTSTTTTTRGSGSGSGATGTATPSSGASEKAIGSIAAGFLAAVAAFFA